MKGRNYLLITSILIIAGAIAGFILNTSSNLLPAYLHTTITTIICSLFLLTGVLGLVFRNRAVFICYFLGFLLCGFSIISIPLMFWIGGGTAPFGLVLAGLAYFMIFGMYLTGVFLNKKVPRKEIHFIPSDFIPLRHHL